MPTEVKIYLTEACHTTVSQKMHQLKKSGSTQLEGLISSHQKQIYPKHFDQDDSINKRNGNKCIKDKTEPKSNILTRHCLFCYSVRSCKMCLQELNKKSEYQDVQNIPSILDFYEGKSILITGVTGFLGKGLLEKLLYSCTGVNKIYVLIRNKKGIEATERLKQLLNSSAFDRLKESGFAEYDKIIPISGTLETKDLGLSDEDLETLKQNVSVVFHLAASINFHETLKSALTSNVSGTIEILKLCHSMKNLQAFIYVSTAFSNADQSRIEEIVYPNNITLAQVTNISELFSDNEDIMKHILGKKPNTYTYTKALAEEIVMNENKVLPLAIIRPSIVISAVKEPSPGWIDNWNGSTGIFVGMSSGVMKVIVSKGSNITDLVPLDIVTNLTIVAATKCQRSSPKVYNCCTGKSNPITCKRAEILTRKATYKHSINKWPFPFLIFTSNYILYNILRIFLQVLPAFLIDMWSVMNGKRPIQMKVQEKIKRMVDLVKHFFINQWDFEDKNVRKLFETMTEEDKVRFNFDVTTINWESCVENYVLGATKHLVEAKPRKVVT